MREAQSCASQGSGLVRNGPGGYSDADLLSKDWNAEDRGAELMHFEDPAATLRDLSARIIAIRDSL